MVQWLGVLAGPSGSQHLCNKVHVILLHCVLFKFLKLQFICACVSLNVYASACRGKLPPSTRDCIKDVQQNSFLPAEPSHQQQTKDDLKMKFTFGWVSVDGGSTFGKYICSIV